MNTPRTAHRGSTDGRAPRRGDPLARARGAYDLVVVGSGLAGLTAANLLGRSGFTVALLEQHYNLGGLATWFKRRGGHVFDISLHGFPVGMKKTCRKYWNRTIADSIVQLESIRFDNPQFSFETDFTREDFTRHLVETFGLERARVDEFFGHLRAMNFYDDSGETIGELFEHFFPGRNDVHRLLMEPISYANGSSLDDPAITYGIVFSNFMSKGVFTFSGGTDRLIREMKAELARNGVDVFHGVEVERILVESGRVHGVEAAGRVIETRAVLSNASIKATVEHLVGAEHFSEEFQGQVGAVRLSNSSCQVYLGLRRGESIPFVTDLLFTSTRERFDSPSLCDMHGESRTFSFYYPKTRPGSDRYTIVSSTNAHHADWADLSPQRYVAEKERMVAETIEHLERFVPGVGAKIDHAEAATPRTFGFYTQHPAGASFGTKFEGLACSMGLSEELEGLFHAGSVGIIMSGWLGAANYGAIASNKIDALLRRATEVPA
ncbi:MAG: NAD(P)-binding protein [Planctomycetota bacterium]|nr:NAD(P)-binding protein [Planctomycetota bacterium]MDP6764125.1 NAD(P)-binding protein [Planctomycetota bacterium]MDP6989586.1 NAD(P)-binding protein [Planctomycetota bacterium]